MPATQVDLTNELAEVLTLLDALENRAHRLLLALQALREKVKEHDA